MIIPNIWENKKWQQTTNQPVVKIHPTTPERPQHLSIGIPVDLSVADWAMGWGFRICCRATQKFPKMGLPPNHAKIGQFMSISSSIETYGFVDPHV